MQTQLKCTDATARRVGPHHRAPHRVRDKTPANRPKTLSLARLDALLQETDPAAHRVAVAHLLNLALKDHAGATLLLARCLLEGKGTVADPHYAIELLELGIEDPDWGDENRAMARSLLGDAFRLAMGTTQDIGIAFDLYMQASEYKVHGALYQLGLWYERRDPAWAAPRANPEIAAYYYAEGAYSGCDRCATALALLHLSGRLIACDQRFAMLLLNCASSNGHADATRALDHFTGRNG